jgi:hypothetical protein
MLKNLKFLLLTIFFASSIVNAWPWDSFFVPKIDDTSPENIYLSCTKIKKIGSQKISQHPQWQDDIDLVIDKTSKKIRVGKVHFPLIEKDIPWALTDGFISHETWYTSFDIDDESSKFIWNASLLLSEKSYIWSIKSSDKYLSPITTVTHPYGYKGGERNHYWTLNRINLDLKRYQEIGYKRFSYPDLWQCEILENHEKYRQFLLEKHEQVRKKQQISSQQYRAKEELKAEKERIEREKKQKEKEARKAMEKI